jgi:phosphoribosylaminoimidazole synthetase
MLVKGGNPLMFLDYIASSKLEKSVVSAIVSGMSDECIRHNCFLIGGETAEMPGIYTDGSYDIVGTMIGTVSQKNIVDGDSICENSKVWGIRSDSPHTNGYSAIRKCYSENADFNYYCKTHGEFADWLTAPHRCYLPEIKQVGIQNILGMCHITGGGYQDNLSRVMPKTLGLRLQREKIFTPEWRVLQKYMRLEDTEMLKTFNCGIGMVVFTKPDCVVPDEFIEIGEIFPTDNSSVQFI